MGKVDQYAFARAIRSTGRGVEGLCALFVPLAAPAPGSLADALPEEYVAVRFYFRPSFPDSSSNRAFASETIRTLTERSSVVLLNTGIELDEHRDFDPGNGVTRLDGLMSAETNLAVQTVAISRARGFVGTYGGLAYLGPFLGVPSISFSSEPEHTQPWHLALAQAVAAEPGFAACVTGRPDEASTDALLRRHVAGWDAR
jgi:hypothetical protein